MQITSAALNTKTDFQVAVTPEVHTIYNEVENSRKILNSEVKTTSRDLSSNKNGSLMLQYKFQMWFSCKWINPTQNVRLPVQYFINKV